MIRKIIREEIEGFKDSNEEDWEWTEGEIPNYTGYYIFNPPINKNQWLDLLGVLEDNIDGIVWSSGVKLKSNEILRAFDDVNEIYGIGINTDSEMVGNNLRTYSNLTNNDSNSVYNRMENSHYPKHNGREFFNI